MVIDTIDKVTKSYYNKLYVSSKSLSELTGISLADLKLETRHTGHYILCRTIEPANCTSHIVTLIEDNFGVVDILALNHFIKDPTESLNDVIPPGSILIIKEPYYRILGDSQQVRVDTPSDVERVRPGDALYQSLQIDQIQWTQLVNGVGDKVMESPVPKTPESWKARGNQIYLKKHYRDALQAYSNGIQLCQESGTDLEIQKTLYLNRAACYISLERYQAALKDAEWVLERDAHNQKGLYRAGKACYAIRKYHQALEHFKEFDQFYHSENSQYEMNKAQERVREKETGVYDMHAMYQETLASKNPRLDHADYVGPIEVQEFHGRGRGMVATSDIEPGELLIASKAFESVYGNEMKNLAGNFCIRMNLKKDKVVLPQQHQLVTAIGHKILNNPEYADQIYSLCAGSLDTHENKDTYTSTGEALFNTELIDSVCQHNAFSLEDLSAGSDVGNQNNEAFDFGQAQNYGVALFTAPICLVNHACYRNASRYFMGDFAFLHATRPIRKGEEIFISYTNPMDPYSHRQRALKGHGFECACTFCIADRDELEKGDKKRFDLVELFATTINEKIAKGNITVVPQAERTILEIQDLYQASGRRGQCLDLFQPLIAIGSLYEYMGQNTKAAETYAQTLILCGIEDIDEFLADEWASQTLKDATHAPFLPDQLVQCALHVCIDYVLVKKMDLAKSWYRVSRKLARILYGMDEATFVRVYHDFTRDMKEFIES